MNPDSLYADSLVWDAHAGVFPSPGVDLNLLDQWQNNGVDYVSINVGFDVMPWQDTLATLAAFRRWLLLNNDRFTSVRRVEDIDTARSQGKLAVGFDIEGMNALNDDINMVSVYHSLGVRQMLFAYNLNNTAGGGCHDSDTGLTQFGRDIVREMNRVL
jgi:membrane dipeptidase